MDLEIFSNLTSNIQERSFMKNFINELTNFRESNKRPNTVNKPNKYSKYWYYQNFIEDNVAANIGISRWGANIKYHKELSESVNNSILKLTEKEGTLYRKQFMPNGATDNPMYNVDRFDNGNIEHLILPKDKVPNEVDNEDIIFQYEKENVVKIRTDLKEKVVELASKNAKYLKLIENEKNLDYKREGHVYVAIEDDGYVFLKDLTEKRGYVLEDIDFVVDCYKEEGKYQVINGVYKKVNKILFK